MSVEEPISSPRYPTLLEYGVAALSAHDSAEKCKLTFEATRFFTSGQIPVGDQQNAPILPDKPARPLNLITLKPSDMQTKVKGDVKANCIRLIHSQAHIESYAVDLSWDILVRFAGPQKPKDLVAIYPEEVEGYVAPSQTDKDGKTSVYASEPSAEAQTIEGELASTTASTAVATSEYKYPNIYLPEGEVLPRDFFVDWLKVADDEARHYSIWAERLQALGSFYGALPVHDGLWESAVSTKDDFLARLGVVHMVHEAHGLDCGHRLVNQLIGGGDKISAAHLKQIQFEEISHVSAGVKWFKYACLRSDFNLVDTQVALFHKLVRRHFRGQLRPPFAIKERLEAGMTEEWYAPLGAKVDKPKENIAEILAARKKRKDAETVANAAENKASEEVVLSAPNNEA